MGGGPGITRNIFCGKSSQNSPKPVLIFCSSVPMCVFCSSILLKVVSYYDLSTVCPPYNAVVRVHDVIARYK